MSGHRVVVVDKGGLKVVGDSFVEVLQTQQLGVEDCVWGRGDVSEPLSGRHSPCSR